MLNLRRGRATDGSRQGSGGSASLLETTSPWLLRWVSLLVGGLLYVLLASGSLRPLIPLRRIEVLGGSGGGEAGGRWTIEPAREVQVGASSTWEEPKEETSSPAPSSSSTRQAGGLGVNVTGVGRAVHVCPSRQTGPEASVRLARALFPEMTIITKVDTSVPSPERDLLLTNGRCRVKDWPGTILYWDPERGRIEIAPHPRTFYMGPKHPHQIPEERQASFAGMIEHFHVATTVLLDKHYAANDLLKRPVRQQGSPPRFLVYAHSNCVQEREAAFDALEEQARTKGWDLPVAAGRCRGSRPSPLKSDAGLFDSAGKGARWNNSISFRPFRFILAMENNQAPGYISEKIANAFMSGAVPIYHGTEDVYRIFNRRAFVFWDPKDPGKALSQITALMENDLLYNETQSQPILANGAQTLEDYFSLTDDVGGGKLKRKIREMVLEHMLRQAPPPKKSESA